MASASGSSLTITESAPGTGPGASRPVQLIQVQSLGKASLPFSLDPTSALGAEIGLRPHTDSKSEEHDFQLSDLGTEEPKLPSSSGHSRAVMAGRREGNVTALGLDCTTPGVPGGEGRRTLLSVVVPGAEVDPSLSLTGEDEGTDAAYSSEFEFSSPSLPGLN